MEEVHKEIDLVDELKVGSVRVESVKAAEEIPAKKATENLRSEQREKVETYDDREKRLKEELDGIYEDASKYVE